MAAVANATVLIDAVEARVTLGPPRDRFSALVVSTEPPVVLASEVILVMLPFSRLTPLKLAFCTVDVIWLRSAMKSLFNALRLAVSSDVSEAARAFCDICVSRLDTVVPAELATSMIDWPVCRDDLTASSDETVARSVWAIDQIAPLSFALPIARPVETTSWARARAWLVLLRFSRAINAPALVFTLS